MNCKFCDSPMEEGSVICPSCGGVAEPVTPPDEVIERFCPHCGNPMGRRTKRCRTCGKKPTDMSSTVKKLVFGGIALVLALALIIGFSTEWFGLNGPAVQIASAFRTTTHEPFTVYVTSGETSAMVQVHINTEDKDVTMVYTAPDGTTTLAIYEGHFIYKGQSPLGEYCVATDIGSSIDALFDSEKTKDIDWKEILDGIQEGLYEEVSKSVNFEELHTGFKTFAKNLNSGRWLKKNAGFSVKNEGKLRLYRFDPNMYTFLEATASCFRDSFTEEAKYQELLDELEENKATLEKADIHLSMQVQNEKLVCVEFVSEEQSVRVEFTNIGTTTIDEAALNTLLENAEKIS